MALHTLSFNSTHGPVNITLSAGETLLVAGPNGVGKSALLYSLYRSLPVGTGNYLPGHRQVNFNNGWESLGQDLAQLRLNLYNSTNAFSRYKGAWAEDQFKASLKTLMHAENAFNREFRHLAEHDGDLALAKASLKESPLDTLNIVFRAAGFPVHFKVTAEGLSAVRGPAVYGIDALSDGERASLFLISTIVTQFPGSVILVDEPEKHLHPSITGLLIESALRARPDVCFVLASHDIYLIGRLRVAHVLHVKDSVVIPVGSVGVPSNVPEQRIFAAKLIPSTGIAADEVKLDLLGTRSKILFIEGTDSSVDLGLYGRVYLDVKLSPKGGHEKVSEAVSALRNLKDEHWLDVYGIIDGDGRSLEEREALRQKGIFTLDVPSVENLFFLDEAIECFVNASLGFSPGPCLEERLAALGSSVLQGALATKPDIVSLRTSWQLARRLSDEKLSPRRIKDGDFSDITISVSGIFQDAEEEVSEVIQSRQWKRILGELPIKGTQLPTFASQALGARSFSHYRQVILRQMDIGAGAALLFSTALQERLPRLPA